MKPLKLALLAAAASMALTAPAAAQHEGGHMPGMPMPAKKPAAKKPAAKKPAGKKPALQKATTKKAPAKRAVPRKRSAEPAKAAADPHAGHQMPSAPAQPADPHTGHTMPATQPPPTTDPHAGHTMPQAPAKPTEPHAGHMMSQQPAGTDSPAGDAPPPPVPTDHAADRVYGQEAMEMGRHHLKTFHGGQKLSQIMFNIAEYHFGNGRRGFDWAAEGWYGGDIKRLWVKSEGDTEFGRTLEKAEVQALYSHALDPFFNLQVGIRYDFKPDPSRVYAVAGVEGLAPSFFNIEGSLFLSNKGELLARAEGYYDQRITQRLILQPRAELNFAARDIRELEIGSGLSDAEIGVRLRYDIRREFAPYVGVQYRHSFGDTRRFLRAAREDADGWSILTGIRTWF